MHRFLSRSNVGASRWLARTVRLANRSQIGKKCATRSVRVSHRLTPTSTLRRPGAPALAGHAVRADDFVAAVKNLCIVRVRTIPALFLSLIFCFILPGFLRAGSPFDGKIIQSIELQSDGPLNDISYTDLFNLMELREGKSYSASQAERSIQRLFSTEMFHDVKVSVEPAGDRVGVKILLIRKYLIREIKFEGDVKLDRQQLRRELAIRSGEAYSAGPVEETLARLKELYRRHGYYRARILPRFELHHPTARLSLTFQIEAGDQELVNQLDLRVEGDLNEEQILSLAKTREGKPFSRVQLEEDLKAIEDHLIWQGYLRCSVKETIRYSDDEHGVSVAVFIATREHTQIEFQGIEFEREELAFLPIFSQRGTAPFFLEATRKELRQKYQEEGYFLAQVEYETSGAGREPSQVVITVDKGQRFNLNKIRFEGNQFAAAGSLKKILSVEEEGVFSRGKFSTEMAKEDANRIERYYQGRGYKDVQVAHALVLEGSDSRDLTLVFKIQEGQLYLIDTVHFVGNEYLSTKTLFEEIQGHTGTHFSPFLSRPGSCQHHGSLRQSGLPASEFSL